MRIVLASFLLLHGVAHVVGFLGAWAPTRTTIVGDRIDLGVSWIKLVGVAWLLLAVGFAAAGIATLVGVAGWPALVYALAGTSLVLCLLQLPETKFGVALDVALVAALLLGGPFGWW